MHQFPAFPLSDPLSATGPASSDAAAAFLARSPEQRLLAALEALRTGEGVLVLDDEDRENEAGIIYAAESCTEAQMARLIRDGSGIVCLCLTAEACARLDLPPMCAQNTNRQQTAFTVSIEAAEGVPPAFPPRTGCAPYRRPSSRRPALPTCAAPATSFPCGPGPAACWSGAAIRKRSST